MSRLVHTIVLKCDDITIHLVDELGLKNGVMVGADTIKYSIAHRVVALVWLWLILMV